MRTNNQRGTIEGMGAPSNSDEAARKADVDAIKGGVTFTGPAIVADAQGTIASGATATPDVTPTTGKQCFSYAVNGNCTLGALTGTAAMAADTAVAGSIYLTFTGAYTVTLAAFYKLPTGVTNSIAGAAGEVWRVDFQYRKTAARCSASAIKEAA
ncbi:hypothetical protein ABMY26_23875 [Azospirillum sp. HJ39]|uniref:hypothetical protein n=1 Tax=Azospirillum sp. HJ39 TaxID=3159496 RepID=UPI0035576B5F